MAGQRLVYGIVADLEHHMVQAGAVVGVADIHAGPLAHGIQPFQDLDTVGAIGIAVGVVLTFLAHIREYREKGRQTKSKHGGYRSEERREGNECSRMGRSW